MGVVLDFPTQQSQGLAFLDRQVRQLLTERGADQELIDFAAERLTESYTRILDSAQYQLQLNLPEGLHPAQQEQLQAELLAGLETIRREKHALVLELVAELVLREVQLFQLSRD